MSWIIIVKVLKHFCSNVRTNAWTCAGLLAPMWVPGMLILCRPTLAAAGIKGHGKCEEEAGGRHFGAEEVGPESGTCADPDPGPSQPGQTAAV